MRAEPSGINRSALICRLELISSRPARIARPRVPLVTASRCIYGNVKEASESFFPNRANDLERKEKYRTVV
jgi:hypothetical protein